MVKSKYNTETWIKAAKKIHGNKWIYDKTQYRNARTKVCITCPKHGDFWQNPNSHLQGFGCKKCAREKDTFTKEKFVELANLRHENKYIYTNTIYKGALEYLNIECPIHGVFIQKAYSHLQGHGCPKCAVEKNSKNLAFEKEKVINLFKKVHGDKYCYDKVNYKNMQTKVIIICKNHGDFYQKPFKHLQGHGCPYCNNSILENEIKLMLDENKVSHKQKERSLFWLQGLELDFYLPQYNIAIECQGIQHFKPREIFGGKEEFIDLMERDERKRKLCEENGVKLLYYSNLGIKYPYFVFEDKEELLKEIIK